MSDIIGIVGGMGPLAGVSLVNNIISQTKATHDQGHLPVILISFPHLIGDRTAFLDGELSANPAYNILNVIGKLEAADAKVIGMACNSAHAPAIFDVILKALSKRKSKVKLLHMPFETCKYIKDNHGGIRRIGIMATNGTYKTRLYEQLITEMGYKAILPDFQFQNNIIHRMIYDKDFGIKGNSDITSKVIFLLNKAIKFFKGQRADALILGCTELPLILKERKVDDMLVFDSTAIMARALIREATRGASRKPEFLIKEEVRYMH